MFLEVEFSSGQTGRYPCSAGATVTIQEPPQSPSPGVTLSGQSFAFALDGVTGVKLVKDDLSPPVDPTPAVSEAAVSTAGTSGSSPVTEVSSTSTGGSWVEAEASTEPEQPAKVEPDPTVGSGASSGVSEPSSTTSSVPSTSEATAEAANPDLSEAGEAPAA